MVGTTRHADRKGRTMGNTQVQAKDVKPGDKYRALGPGMMLRVVTDVQTDGEETVITCGNFTSFGPTNRLVWLAAADAEF